MVKPADRPSHPDEAKLRADPNNEFRSYQMDAGDMLVLHPDTLHYSSGNTDDRWRIALSVRIFGDDIRWCPRPDCVNLAGVSFDEMVDDEPPKGPLMPLLWSEDGQQDGDSDYPRGFATQWSKTQRRDELNEDSLFKKMLARETD